MFVTNCISTTKIQKILEITNFFRHYFLSRTEVYIRAARENERGTLGSKIGKTLKKEYNIRFKIYPSPFTSLPQPSFHIFIIGLPTLVFWVYPSEIFCYLSEIFCYLSEIFCYLSEIFCYLSELCSYPSEIFFRMIP